MRPSREQAIGKNLEQIDALKIDWESYYPIMQDQDGQLICTGIVDGHYPNEFNDGNWSIRGDDAYAMADDDDIHDGSGDEYGDDDSEPPITGLVTDDE